MRRLGEVRVRRCVFVLMLLALFVPAGGFGGGASAASGPPERTAALGDDPEPEPGTPEWYQRDAGNMNRATGRMQDEYAHPAHGRYFWTETVDNYPQNVADQLHHPDRPIVTLSQWIPGGTTADPYRHHWEGERGVRVEVEYLNRYGARITGNVWGPKLGAPDPVTGEPMNGPFPGVVVTTGSLQGYEELYWWAAQGLAEAGYLVMTYDVQGQGQSETFGHNPDGSFRCGLGGCPGVPFQQAANFVEGTEDALSWFLSSSNPLRGVVDARRVGLAGHSLGASSVTRVGNRDARVEAVVAWDNANHCVNQTDCMTPRVPTMGQNGEYFLNPTPTTDRPNPDARNTTFRAFRDAGVPSMQVALRGSTHLEWTFVPYILPASRQGERVAMYYTLAWFDRWLKDDLRQQADATRRLTASLLDRSSDRSSIGFGSWDPATNSNRPYTIGGECVREHMSFYYSSSWAFDGLRQDDMRRGLSCA